MALFSIHMECLVRALPQPLLLGTIAQYAHVSHRSCAEPAVYAHPSRESSLLPPHIGVCARLAQALAL